MASKTHERRLFVGGATGAVGRTVVRLADAQGLSIVPHVRPATAARMAEGTLHPGAAVCELADGEALRRGMAGCTTVLQLIGTMRKRFAAGDTYATSDVGTTRSLVEAAKDSGVDHLILLSSVGAGRPVGAYLKAKAEAERLVRESGIPFTVFRPSAFIGEGHRIPGVVTAVSEALQLDTVRPIRVERLAATLLHVAMKRAPLGVALEGGGLWREVEAATAVGGRAAAVAPGSSGAAGR